MAEQEWITIFQEKTMYLDHYWYLEFDDRIVPNSPRWYWKQYITSSGASFRCTMCRRWWPSNKVTIVFHMRLMNGHGIVKMKGLGQSCKMCYDAPMEEPKFFRRNIGTILENLVEKIRIKCYYENLGKYERSYTRVWVKSPHEPDHCEGCRLGICN